MLAEIGPWLRTQPKALLLNSIAILLFSASPVWATTTVALYDAGTANNPVVPPDPVSVSGGGWTLFTGPVGSTSPVSDDLGFNAWNMVDNSSEGGASAADYKIALTPLQISNAVSNGWRLNARLRMVDDFDSRFSHLVFFDDGSKRWSIGFDLDSDENLVARLQQNGGDRVFGLTSDGSGAALYHDYSLVYDPSTGNTASFFVDGELKTESYSGLNSVFISEIVRFGTGSSVGQGSVNYNLVQLEIVPEPSTSLSLILGVAGLTLARYRNRRAKARCANQSS